MIFNAFERMVAFRYLRARRQEGFVSVIAIFSLLGIALGVATLIIVMSVMNGFRADLLARILGLNGDLGVYAMSGGLADFDAAAQKIREVPGVTRVTPLVEGQVMATSEAGAAGALVRGIRPDDLRSLPLLANQIVEGSLADFGDDGVAVGDRLALRLGVTVGSPITVLSPHGISTAFGTMPRVKTYQVVAAFNIISSMIMMVKDKGRDIAILRTMGASRAMILRIFVLSGASIGVVGTIAGFALGVAFTNNIEAIRQGIQRLIGTDLFAAEIYFFTRIPARIDSGEVAVVVVMALALSFLATLYPPWRAARLDPVEALRYE